VFGEFDGCEVTDGGGHDADIADVKECIDLVVHGFCGDDWIEDSTIGLLEVDGAGD
jgi:hypothetical protein